MKVCYAGSFDPVTNGHMDIIKRASRKFDEVIVLLMENPRKHYLFSREERIALVMDCVKEEGLSNVTVEIGEGLTVKYARKLGCDAMVRGIRAVSDYEFELATATANMCLDDEMETILLIARPEYSFVSSSVVKEVASNGGEIDSFVPDLIKPRIYAKFSG